MKKRKDMLRGFVLGVMLTALAAAIPAVGAAATKRTIDVVYNDIKLVIDGKEITPLDGAGNPVEPFIYEGTTYLPLRAVSNALTNGEKPVDWDQSTYTIYIGERPVETKKIVNMADLKPYPRDYLTIFLTGTNQSVKVRQKTYSAFNLFDNRWSGHDTPTYLLNGDYTELNGFAAVPDGCNKPGYVQFVNQDTGEELLRVDVNPAEDPVAISLNVTGVDKLRISTSSDSLYDICFFNATLTPISKG